jgi:hypothetical protein
MFENKVLRRIFEPESYEVAGGWRKMHNSVQFNSLLLVCCINSQMTNYRCSTREYKIINITR